MSSKFDADEEERRASDQAEEIAAEEGERESRIIEPQKSTITVPIVGTTPFLCNSLITHGLGPVFIPKPPKSRAERVSTLKHEPLKEFRQSMLKLARDADPTLIAHDAAAFKGAMLTAATKTPGITAVNVRGMVWVKGTTVALYGEPQISIMGVRQQDVPEARTRAILPRWACTIEVEFQTPHIRPQQVLQLLTNAGSFVGVGDGRPEKGKLRFGCFRPATTDDAEYAEIAGAWNRSSQLAAIRRPVCYDDTTLYLLTEYVKACIDQGFEVPEAEIWQPSDVPSLFS